MIGFKNLEEMYTNLRGESSNRRVARGLIDAVGYGLHYLADTVTDEQVNKLEKELDQFAAEAEQTNRGNIRSCQTYRRLWEGMIAC